MARGSGSIFKRGRIWWVQWYANGRARQRSSKSEFRKDAERLLRQIQANATADRSKMRGDPTMDELFDSLVKNYETQGRASLDILKLKLERHLRKFFGHIRAAHLSADHAQDYVALRRTQKAAPATINRELAAVRRALRLAKDDRRISDVPKLPRLVEDNARQGFLEYAEFRRLIDSAPTHIQPVIATGYYVGMRRGELLKIQRSQVDLLSGLIRLPGGHTKNRKPRTVPILQALRPWIEQAMSGTGRWLFEYRGHQITDFRAAWDSATTKAQMPDLLFHDLRRCAVRNLERAGVPRSVAMAITGHKTEAVYRRYDIVSERDLADAAERIEAFLAKEPLQKPLQSEATKKTSSSVTN